MAVEYTHTSTNGDIVFDFTNEEINCENTIDYNTVQEIVDGFREAEDSFTGIAFNGIGNASGKDTLASGVTTGITLELLEGWIIYSQKSSGTYTIKDGNIIQTGGGTIFKANPLVAYIRLGAVDTSIVTSGSGLSAAQATQLENASNWAELNFMTKK